MKSNVEETFDMTNTDATNGLRYRITADATLCVIPRLDKLKKFSRIRKKWMCSSGCNNERTQHLLRRATGVHPSFLPPFFSFLFLPPPSPFFFISPHARMPRWTYSDIVGYCYPSYPRHGTGPFTLNATLCRSAGGEFRFGWLRYEYRRRRQPM